MNYSQSFGFSSGLMLALTLPVILMIREPSPKTKRPLSETQEGAAVPISSGGARDSAAGENG